MEPSLAWFTCAERRSHVNYFLTVFYFVLAHGVAVLKPVERWAGRRSNPPAKRWAGFVVNKKLHNPILASATEGWSRSRKRENSTHLIRFHPIRSCSMSWQRHRPIRPTLVCSYSTIRLNIVETHQQFVDQWCPVHTAHHHKTTCLRGRARS